MTFVLLFMPFFISTIRQIFSYSSAVDTPNRCTTLIPQLGLALVREGVLGLRNLTDDNNSFWLLSEPCTLHRPQPSKGHYGRFTGTKWGRWSLCPERGLLSSLALLTCFQNH